MAWQAFHFLGCYRMKRLDDLTVKTSWLLVILAFTFLVLSVAGLAAYAANAGGTVSTGWLNLAIGTAIVFTLVLVAIILWGVSVNVIRPLKRLVEHFERLAEGDLSGEIESRGNNEIGRLFAALERTQAHLLHTVGNTRNASDNVHQGAIEIAQGNTDLSARTEQQAAALEETAASMEQLTSTVRQNTDNARQASQLADDASAVAREGGDVVGKVVTTMHDISDQSRQVVEILDTIDSIAFQTNILALNASVEAARAGAQGRGFAVVAHEVQTLATRSADAAKEIRELIQRSAERVEDGAQLADKAGATMKKIVTAIGNVDAIMHEIATASEEQSHGIDQVNQAITQMDQVTQQNAALVQQAADNARALERESEALQAAVAVFRLSASESVALPATPQPTRPQPRTQSGTQPPLASARQEESEWETF